MSRDLVVDVDACARILRHGTVADLLKLRAELNATKKRIESQLSDDTAAMRGERAELLAGGMHPREADLRSGASGDPDWRHRAAGANRVIDVWFGKIKARLTELTPAGQPNVYAAVSVPGVAKNGETAAKALNALLTSGCKIVAFAAIGVDLVVVATDPKSMNGEG